MDLQANSFLPSSSSSSSSSSCSFSHSWTYDVFLSFRGSDTRYGFTGNLYKSLSDKGIRTFIDDEELQRGDEITPSLIKAIKESRISIVVFSKNYASSSFCLEELATIMECVHGNGRLVYPIFYKVDPSDIRHQKASYGEAMAKHEESFKDDMPKLQKWRDVLRQAANLSGKDVKIGYHYEYVYIENITKEIFNMILHVPLYVTKYPVGLDSRVLKVYQLLNIKFHSEVIMVGIHGIGGIGKTTLAKAVYNLIASQFEGYCFLEKVRENTKKHGLEHLQEVVISKLLGIKDIKLESVSEGIPILQRLRQKNVLLILDDVDEPEQLRAIIGAANWFGSGSRVIITTRDIHLLESHGIERTYEVRGLSEKDACQFLSWKAFKCKNTDPSYRDILKQAVTYACGLPLALEVIGSNLFGKSIQEWKFTLDRYKKIPHKDIQKILRISFDALEEFQKKLFLDIACCFSGCWWPEIIYKLQACYDVPLQYDINKLVQKSLLNIDCGFVMVHDLIRDMGREIVYQQSRQHPGKRSRLWIPKDIVQVLEDDSGTGEIEIITLDAPKYGKVVVEWDGNAFKKMENLKILIIRNTYFSQGAKYLPNSLRVLEWQNHPSNSLPCVFNSKRKFVNLRSLNLNNSDIFEIPDLSSVPNLEELSFQDCKNLIKVHESVGFLDKLSHLGVARCNMLKTFPALKLPCLRGLDFMNCSSLESFPEILGNMEKFTEIIIQGTLIKELPSSFTKLRNLKELYIIDVLGMLRIPSSIFSMLQSLCFVHISKAEGLQCLKEEVEESQRSSTVSLNETHVVFRDCNMLDESVAMVLALFCNVVCLDLSKNSFTLLPENIKELCSLRKLYLDDCKKLEEIRGIPPNIKELSAKNCKSLSPLNRSMLLDKELHNSGEKMFVLPGRSIPKWLEHRGKSKSISFWFRNKLPPFSLCVAGNVSLRAFINGIERDACSCYVLDGSSHTTIFDKVLSLENEEGLLSKNEWNRVVFRLRRPESKPVKFGFYVHKKENNMEDIRFTEPLLQEVSMLGFCRIMDLQLRLLPTISFNSFTFMSTSSSSSVQGVHNHNVWPLRPILNYPTLFCHSSLFEDSNSDEDSIIEIDEYAWRWLRKDDELISLGPCWEEPLESNSMKLTSTSDTIEDQE